MDIFDLIRQSQDGRSFGREQLVAMLGLPPASTETFEILAEARRISSELTANRAEVHAQLALNLAPCPRNCKFCSFAASNGVFRDARQLSLEEAVDQALQLEAEGANAVYVMTTAHYDFGEFLEVVQEIKRNLQPATPLIANVGDVDAAQARSMRAAGIQGVYHALRLGEGKDTTIAPERRIRSIEAFKEAGLSVGTCVEPVGPEHTDEELAEMILFTDRIAPAYSGAARRISIPGTELARRYGMISELRMVQIVAITRLALSRSVRGNCTHEPCTLGAAAGANLLWAEIGANPRDTKEKTEEGRGHSVPEVKRIFREADWEILEGPSIYYAPGPSEG